MCHDTNNNKKEAATTSTPVMGDGSVPPLPNSLYNRPLHDAHVRSLRLEAELAPMRTILSKLMNHAKYNRRGIFNSPVDPIALGLPDYERIVTKPMDLGTIKAKLHALVYSCRDDVAEDIRLVFRNAILYNPPNHFVHQAARNILGIFEAGYLNACQRMGEHVELPTPPPELAPPEPLAPTPTVPVVPSIAPTPAVVGSQAAMLARAATAEKAADENSISAHTRNASSLPVEATLSSALKKAAAKRLAPTAPKLPVHTTGDGKVPPWLRPNRKMPPPHTCSTCLGRKCAMCEQGCLLHEPTLLICSGTGCGSSKIRKTAVYYVAPDGTRQYCQKCYAGLGAVLPQSGDQSDSYDSTVRYKKHLLKRKNDEEIAENWLTCTKCNRGVHQVCAMHNEVVHQEEGYVCPTCISEADADSASTDACSSSKDPFYTFVSGVETPVPMSQVGIQGSSSLSADKLKETSVSAFIEQKVRERMVVPDCANADKTVSVRIISECDKSFSVPDVVRKHFRMPNDSSESHLDATVVPPETVNYKSIAIALFQKIDGLDVCIFCMYVQEYDGDDDYGNDLEASSVGQGKRVYIAYLDSVEHFRPRSCRTDVYHEMLVAYLATARARGYETAHIWACPPSRGNSFVFWNHPSSQRTPTRERLISWYHGALHRAVDTGVVTDVKSLYESAFHEFMTKVRDEETNETVKETEEFNSRPGRMLCPPLLDGDFWIEEAQRIHAASLLRYLKSKAGVKEAPVSATAEGALDVACPVLQVASLLRNISALDIAEPFRRPVNAAALDLKDYHSVISRPMDLGTIYSRLVLGEFEDLREFASDVKLVFANAMRFNPVGHPIHTKAVEVQAAFFRELNALAPTWDVASKSEPQVCVPENLWLRFADLSMNLDTRMVGVQKPTAPLVPSVTSEGYLPTKPLPSETNDVPPSVQAVVSADEASLPLPETTEVPPARADASVAAPPPPVSAPVPDHTSSSGELQPSSVLPVEPVASSSTSASSAAAELPAKKRGRKPKPLPQRLDLLTGGPDAVHHSMVGDDVWLLDRRNIVPQKNPANAKKKKNGKRKKTVREVEEEPPSKRRRQSWLGEEVGVSMRKIRTAFFTCSLTPKEERSDVEHGKLENFDEYIAPFAALSQQLAGAHVGSCRVADARHGLLEFSQYRNFEFDTLRRAKYSTSMLLYHLHHDNAPGLIPLCTKCHKTIHHVRWHEIRKRSVRNSREMAEELCPECYSKRGDSDKFLPLPVSFRSSQHN